MHTHKNISSRNYVMSEKKKYLQSIYILLREWRKNMLGSLIVIVLAVGIGMFNHSNQPAQYELTMEDGSQTLIILKKNSQYACPIYCEADHIHRAIMCKNDIQTNKYQSVYHIAHKGETDLATFCSIKQILTMYRLSPRSVKNKLPDVVSASTEE